MNTLLLAGRGTLALFSLLLIETAGAETRLQLYPSTPGEQKEERVKITVNQNASPLLARRIWHSESSGRWFAEVAYVRLAADGPVQIELDPTTGKFLQPVCRTLGAEIPVARRGDGVSLNLPGPGQYYLQLPELAQSNATFTVAVWVDDLRQLERTQSRLRSEGAINVVDRGIRPDPLADQTKAVQALLDTRGTFYFPAGLYRVGTLHVRSNTTVYLAPGAVVRALDENEALGTEFIAIENASHVKLCGQGTFDANSLRSHRLHNAHHVNLTSARDVILEDLLFEDSNSWAIHIRKSDHFTARNLKIFSGKDGFDPDASRDVLIEGAFIVSADDGLAVKNRFPKDVDGGTTERVIFRDSIVCSLKSALKIGTETCGPIRDVTIENCDVFDGERAVVLYANDGGPVERAVWRNLRLSLRDWTCDKESGAVFHFVITRREGATPVKDCLVENVTANWIYRSEFVGLPDAPLDGLILRNITARVERPKSSRRSFLFEAGQNVRLPIQGLSVEWQGNQGNWAGIASGAGLMVLEAGPAKSVNKTTQKTQ